LIGDGLKINLTATMTAMMQGERYDHFDVGIWKLRWMEEEAMDGGS